MTEKLPISIQPSNELMDKFIQIKAISNKLEAELNFKTMTAGWYGDEENIHFINLIIDNGEEFLLQKIRNHQGSITEFSDDVFSFYDETKNITNCFIAITETEQKVLSHQEKIVPVFIHKKLQKILNLIAVQHRLLPI